MSWSDGLKSMFDSLMSGFQKDTSDSAVDTANIGSIAPSHPDASDTANVALGSGEASGIDDDDDTWTGGLSAKCSS